jgi:hypothetical protein
VCGREGAGDAPPPFVFFEIATRREEGLFFLLPSGLHKYKMIRKEEE